ncbi:hypothetical protein AYI68_g7457 [Smittium mucronatum]|uniref:Uncharacterized protein n=1 Tax=Smittium mucronatum TaxID=133383 RepID=A0A1R0GNN2_9FUNG|nr:hypothetical protein AYI68_g7457 [Smittium mucronatum]
MLHAPRLAHLSPSPSRDLWAGITLFLRLFILIPLLPVLTTLSVFTASMVGIIGENLIWRLVSALNERPIKENMRSFISASPAKLTDGYKSSPSAKASEEIDTGVSLSLSSTALHQALTSGENPQG